MLHGKWDRGGWDAVTLSPQKVQHRALRGAVKKFKMSVFWDLYI